MGRFAAMDICLFLSVYLQFITAFWKKLVYKKARGESKISF